MLQKLVFFMQHDDYTIKVHFFKRYFSLVKFGAILTYVMGLYQFNLEFEIYILMLCLVL